jgi:glycosyltransferase involved in cell wall biosynthesis
MSRILLVHNFYQQRGGEDSVFSAEADLLRSHCHEVREYDEDNRRIDRLSCITVGLGTLWSTTSYKHLRTVLEEWRPDVAHFHNTFPLISPSAYWACRHAKVPVVQTLHNYRLACPVGTFFREGQVCEDCATHSLVRSVRHACYRQSRPMTAAVAANLLLHRFLRTWTTAVDCYIGLSEFSRNKFIQLGIPANKIAIKPNFAPIDPGVRTGEGSCAVYIGRLSVEKGLATLLAAWKQIGDIPLVLLGDGPLRETLRRQISLDNLNNVQLFGLAPADTVTTFLKKARFLVLPSVCYENFPLSMVEAYAAGVPVIASRLGALNELIVDGKTGLHFTAGDADDLRHKARILWVNSEQAIEMGHAARRLYESRYTKEKNYEMLMTIYRTVQAKHGSAHQSVATGAETFLGAEYTSGTPRA